MYLLSLFVLIIIIFIIVRIAVKHVASEYRGKNKPSDDDVTVITIPIDFEFPESFIGEDYLYLASEAGSSAKQAVIDKEYDQAWRSYHEQKSFYMQHANSTGFTPVQALALDATVSAGLANVLRLEGKHKQALVHIIYLVAAQSEKGSKGNDKKLGIYFRRCKYSSTSLSDVEEFIETIAFLPNFRAIQNKVSEWE